MARPVCLSYGTAVRVLIIDDSVPFLRAARAFVLAQPDVEDVAIAQSGQAGLDLYDRHRADLVLVDLVMPGLDGFETTRRLKTRSGAPTVIVVSLVEDPTYTAAAAAAGADGFMAKSDLPAMFAGTPAAVGVHAR
jgi:DNA-binding NarL/FixJ family response regulator